jgi:hypothetical protein
MLRKGDLAFAFSVNAFFEWGEWRLFVILSKMSGDNRKKSGYRVTGMYPHL